MLKIGILTYHRALNYGAYLQAYALCSKLRSEKDFSVEIIDYKTCKEIKRYYYNWNFKKKILHLPAYYFSCERKKGFKRAQEEYADLLSKDSLCSDSLNEFNEFILNKYDVVIVGSDEIWNFNNFRGFPNAYWLIGNYKFKKISYAASSRQDFSKLSEENLNIIKDTLNSFSLIGVRDSLTANEIKKLVEDKEKVFKCCDPSFIYEYNIPKIDFSKIIKDYRYDKKKKNAFVMATDKNLCKYLYKKLRKEYNMISVCDYHFGYINVPNITAFEWLALLNQSDIVLTTYFHPTCFSIILNKSFLSFATKARSSKVEEVICDNNLDEYYVKNIDSMIKNDSLNTYIEKAEKKHDFSNIIEKYRFEFDSFTKYLHSLTEDVTK